MHIHEFHHKFTSTAEPCDLFAALRSLCHIEDAKDLIGGDTGYILVDWSQWPAMATQ
jgi:hypothetical protein